MIPPPSTTEGPGGAFTGPDRADGTLEADAATDADADADEEANPAIADFVICPCTAYMLDCIARCRRASLESCRLLDRNGNEEDDGGS